MTYNPHDNTPVLGDNEHSNDWHCPSYDETTCATEVIYNTLEYLSQKPCIWIPCMFVGYAILLVTAPIRSSINYCFGTDW
jgi:hypothetical protein